MKTRGKVLLLIVSAMALVIASIFGTLAYLTDTEAVTNTFTVGHVDITLDEAKVNECGKPVNKDNKEVTDLKDAERVQSNEYHLIPGHVYTKDPTVTVKKGSEESYVRIKVDVENIDKLEAALPDSIKGDDGNSKYYADLDNNNDLDFVLEKLLNNTWEYKKWVFKSYAQTVKSVETGEGENAKTENIIVGTYEFWYNEVVGEWGGSDADERLEPLFTQIMIPGADIDNTRIENLESVKVVVRADAIQKDGFKNAEEAWETFDGQTVDQKQSSYKDSITQTSTPVTP